VKRLPTAEPNALFPSTLQTGRRPLYGLACAVLLACIVSYAAALAGPLFFDDVPNLLANALLRIDGRTIDDWRVAALSSGSGVFFRPVAMLTFALNHVVAGSLSAFSLKATNLGIHLVIGALVYLFTVTLLQAPALREHRLSTHHRRIAALLAASIWLLHPIHVSTVLYAVQRMAQLSALFTLAGLLVFIRYRLRWAGCGAGAGEVLAAFIWVALLGLLGLLSKENGALLPWLIAVVEVILFRGVWRGKPCARLRRLGYLALLMPLLAALLVYIIAPELITGRFAGREFTLQERLLSQGRALWQYLSWLLVPDITSMGFFHDDIPLSRSLWSPLTTVVSLLAWAAVLGACVLWHKRLPLVAFAFLFYLVAHSMESTVWPLEMVFEHRNYLPSVGFAVLAGVGVLRCVSHLRGVRLRAVLAGILGILVVLLAVRAYAWRDELALARYEVMHHPLSARANFFYANALYKRFEQARALGLDEDEQRALAVTSRQHFERMHSLDERDFAAPVMLYQLDTLYFPALAPANDWLGRLQELAKTRRLQSSDRTALAALVEFSLSPAGEPGRARVRDLVDSLGERYPDNTNLLRLRYRMAVAAGARQRADLLPALERAVQSNRDSREAAALLAQYHGVDDQAATYEAIREWLRRDEYRRELPVIRGIFSE
jgi:hypothetical protein